ncbi:MAG: ChaN family lipoprotein [Thermoanaerobaculales bacterium]|jgi:uncharacterized iron-regulated protein|nr:ChaN family lipoprotein [Thermoanaerobaculales bacterium]
MRLVFIGLAIMSAMAATAQELDMLPIGDPERANELGSAEAGAFYDSAAGGGIDFDAMVERMTSADVVLLGEEHTAMDQKLMHARLLDAMAASGKKVVLAMEFFLREDGEVLRRWSEGELDERGLLEATGWYDRGGYRWDYYRPVMEVARERGVPVVGANVPRSIPRTVNRGGLDGLSEEQRARVGEVTTDGSPQHRYLISRYFGDTVAMLPPGWFDNMYAAQCLWDVVMARSVLDVADTDTTVVLIVGSGHIAYGLGIPRRIADERAGAGLPALDVVSLCPATAPAPPEDGEPTGHPMGGGHGMGGAAAPRAQFARSLADFVAVFPDRGGIVAYPTFGFKLKADDDDRPVVSIVFPDTLAESVGFATGDRILDVNGAEMDDLGGLRFELAGVEWGERIGLGILRGAEELEIAALLFPTVDISSRDIAPGYQVQAMHGFDPDSTATAADAVIPDDAARWSLVSDDAGWARVEVRVDGVLDEVHELDEQGRVARSLYRIAREDGAVDIRYERDGVGNIVATEHLDRMGVVLD